MTSRPERTYPSGRRVFTCWDRLGRASWTKQVPAGRAFPATCDPANPAVLGDEQLRASVQEFAPHGAIGKMTLGNQRQERWCYNDRLQPTAMHLGNQSTTPCTSEATGDLLHLQWSYGSQNNGNIQWQKMWYPKGAADVLLRQDYAYDLVNRLTGASESIERGTGAAWNLSWEYDYAGNLRLTGSAGINASASMPTDFSQYEVLTGSKLTNRLTRDRATVGAAYAINYDLSGQMTSRPGAASRDHFEWDGEGRIRRHLLGTNERTRYDYDAEGRRVRKVEATGNTVYVYDGDGNLAAEYGGAAVAGIRYVTVDHLGSTRMTTNAAGAEVERIDYLPFGEELTVSAGQSREGVAGFGSAVGVRQRFTGKERDAETGLDYFGARYFSGVQGRFTRVTPARMADPQRFNLYAYARNNPFKFIDPRGEDIEFANDTEEGRKKALALITRNLSAREATVSRA